MFVVLAVIGLPLLAATALMLPETLPADRRHSGGLCAVVSTFGRLLRDRRFSSYAASFSLSFAAMFAYIAGSSFVLEDIYGISPQLFSVVFATNSAGLIAFSVIAGRAVSRLGADRLLRRGLVAIALAALAALVVTVTHAGLGWLLVCFFVLPSANGIVMPTGTAAAMAGQSGALGAASALLGVGQFFSGALVAPLVGLAGNHDALPMAVVIAVAGSGALLINLLLAPRSPRSEPHPT